MQCDITCKSLGGSVDLEALNGVSEGVQGDDLTGTGVQLAQRGREVLTFSLRYLVGNRHHQDQGPG